MTNTSTSFLKNSSGFTLLEILIAMGIVSIGLLAVFQLQARNLDLHDEARFITVANFLAQDRLSRIQAGGNLEAGTSSGDFDEDHPLFRYEEKIEGVDDAEHLFKLVVTITQGEGETARHLSLVAYLHRQET